MNNKKRIITLSLFSLVVAMGLSIFGFVRADDEEDEDREEKAATTTMATSSASKQETKTVKQTIIVSPERIVTENQIRMITLPDTDRDGITDGEDPHPEVPEIYIVQDDNFNGIVDKFE